MLAAIAVAAAMLVAPAQASTSINTTISNAEAVTPAAAATLDTVTSAPVPTGNGISVDGLDIAFDGGGGTSTSGELLLSGGSGLTYAADQLDADTIRLSAVLQNSSARASWTFRGAELQTFEEAGLQTISVVRNNELVGVIEAPWATDANGKALPTRYEVRGPKLMQIVETDASTAWPVVADPTFKKRWYGATVYLNKSESIAVTGTVASCIPIFSKSPHWSGKALSIGCGTFAAMSTSQIALGKCVRVNVHGVPPVLATWYPWWGTC